MASRGRILLKALLLGLLVWLVYWNSLANPFHFDDWHVISENPAVHSLENLPRFFTDIETFSLLPGNRDYRPFFLVSMALGWWAGGGVTLPFHLVSVTLHLVNSLLLMLILLLIFEGSRDPVQNAPAGQKETAAWLGGLIFALHPLASQTVNYISNQSVLWVGTFYLLSLYLFLRVHSDPPRTGALRRGLLGGLSCFSYFLALLSKPIAITLPLNLLLWELLLNPKGGRPASESLTVHWRRRLLKHVPHAGVSVAYLLMRRILVPEPFDLGYPVRPLLDHYLTQTKALVFYYLRLAAFPWPQNADIGYPVSTSLLEPPVAAALLLLVLTGFLLFRFRRHRLLLFWALWFPAALLVTTYLVVLIQVVSEHHVYVSLAGFCGLVSTLWLKARSSLPFKISDFSLGERSGRAILAAAAVLTLAVFSGSTRERNRIWSSDLSLWRDAALNGGTWRAHMNYGLALEETEEKEEALAQFQEAVRMSPNAWAHINLGNAYMRRGSHELGMWHLRQAVELWSTLSEARLYLGYGLERIGQYREAEEEFRQAVELRPNYPAAHRALARFYETQGRLEEALAAYRAFLEVAPTQSWVGEKIATLEKGESGSMADQVNQALGWIRNGQYREAVMLLSAARESQPRDPELLFNLAFAHQRLGEREEAVAVYEDLLGLAPDHVQGSFNLAYAYRDGSSAEWEKAAGLFSRVLEFNPDYTEAIFHLATVLWKLGREEEARRFDERYLEEGTHPDLRSQSQRRLATGGPD